MKYSITIATTLIVAAKSFTNITCNTTADCLADEWCFDKECYPGCNIDGGVDCEWDIGFNFVCNENTGECYEPNCNNTAGFCEAELPNVVGVKCVDYSFGDFGCEASPCNVTDDGTMYCPDPYVCDEWEDYCVESCVMNNYCGQEESFCNATTGLCQQEYCFNSDCPTADTYCWLGFLCLDYCSDTSECPSDYICVIEEGGIGTCQTENCANSGNPDYCLENCGIECPECSVEVFGGMIYAECVAPTCFENTDCDENYICDNEGEGYQSNCVEDCRVADICDGGSYCTAYGACSSYCVSDKNCTDGYVCSVFENDCIAACTNNTYCIETFDTDMTVCNNMTGLCEFPCSNNTDCSGLGAFDDVFVCANATNTTAGECEKVPACVADPTLCPLQSAAWGYEFECNEVSGECEPVWCSNTAALDMSCSADSSICVEEEGYPVGFCVIPCMSNDDCFLRIAAAFEPDLNWTCGEFGNCYVPNITTEAPMMSTTMDMGDGDGDGDDMMTSTTDPHDDHDHGTDGVQGYGVMMVLGVIVVMISFM